MTEQTRTARNDLEQIVEALILQGVDYSAAEDKAFMAKDREAEFTAHAAYEATVKALAIVLGVDHATANEAILSRA